MIIFSGNVTPIRQKSLLRTFRPPPHITIFGSRPPSRDVIVGRSLRVFQILNWNISHVKLIKHENQNTKKRNRRFGIPAVKCFRGGQIIALGLRPWVQEIFSKFTSHEVNFAPRYRPCFIRSLSNRICREKYVVLFLDCLRKLVDFYSTFFWEIYNFFVSFGKCNVPPSDIFSQQNIE